MDVKKFTITAIFISIILLFAFTPFGFIHLGVIKATIIHIPIIIAAILLGPKIGALLGLVFGITSIIINTMSPTLLSFAFSPAIPIPGTDQGSFWAIVIAIVPRVILGFIPYYLYKAFKKFNSKKKDNNKIPLFLTGLITTIIHTFLVMGSIALIFNDAYQQAVDVSGLGGIIVAILTVFFTNGVAEAVLAGVITVAVVPPLLKVTDQEA